MTRPDGATVALAIIAAVLVGGVLLLEVLAPSSVASAALFSIVVFYCWLFRSGSVVATVAIAATFLSFADVVLLGRHLDDVSGVNRLVGVVVIWVSTSLVYFTKASMRELEVLTERLEEQAKKLAGELELAERIQTSILPSAPLAPGVEVSARMVPASEVGGDYYDVLPTEDGCWLAIGDVSGHGLQAGVMSLMVQSATSAILRSSPEISLFGAVSGLNETLYDNIKRRLLRDEFVTYSLLRYTRDGRVSHCGAHEDILVYRARTRQVERHATVGAWLGIGRRTRAKCEELLLEDGDVMVLLTDGLFEGRDAAGRMLGIESTAALLGRRAEAPVRELVDALVEQTLRWTDEVQDDITCIALRHRAQRDVA